MNMLVQTLLWNVLMSEILVSLKGLMMFYYTQVQYVFMSVPETQLVRIIVSKEYGWSKTI